MKRSIPFAAVACAVVLTAISAPLVAAAHPLAALALRSFFSRLCHQDPARSFFLDGAPVAVCVRCLGIYCGCAVGAVLGSMLRIDALIALRIFLGSLLLSLLDAIAETLHLHGNLPVLRFFLGIFAGLASVLLLTLQHPPPKVGACSGSSPDGITGSRFEGHI